jgi:hypothetical protein
MAARCSRLALVPPPRVPPSIAPKAAAISERLKRVSLLADMNYERPNAVYLDSSQHDVAWARVHASCALGLINWIRRSQFGVRPPERTIKLSLSLSR